MGEPWTAVVIKSAEGGDGDRDKDDEDDGDISGGGERNDDDADGIACGGAFVVLNHDGDVRVERGFIRPEDDKRRQTTAEGRVKDDEQDRICEALRTLVSLSA